ncbi:unnamed protein product [Bursaphelenchus xylophilus]|uniref:(pine wood nematode) hypothetical protein n=1 Tax=Bursaphelenchus xylophilus TaxID=6326 RepID=A0A7I8XR89_BURXY|nr:unnamed protein product [Bursaphelenchus xylophilus]CAG9088778.1 unnamed protein product [Bursaphelenchus xylophilus]
MRWNQIKGGGPNQDNDWFSIGEDQVQVDKFWVIWGHFDVKIMENGCWIGFMEMKMVRLVVSHSENPVISNKREYKMVAPTELEMDS